jgi:hypothetical protein
MGRLSLSAKAPFVVSLSKIPFVVSLSNHALCEEPAKRGSLLVPRKAWFDKLTTNGIHNKAHHEWIYNQARHERNLRPGSPNGSTTRLTTNWISTGHHKRNHLICG